MRTFDFSPLFRSTVGFDHVFDLIEDALRVEEPGAGYPPYNIEKLDEDSYRITVAVAGFERGELDLEVRDNLLVVTGRRKDDDESAKYLYHGIAGRAFERTFRLADFVKVVGADLENGLLHIELVREIPEEMKPRKIEIAAGGKGLAAGVKKLIGGKEAA